MNIKSVIKNKLVRTKKEKVLIPSIEGHYLENRCAFITGASSGIGYSIAESFLKNGATVIITGRNEERLKNAKNKLIEKYKFKENKIIIAKLDITQIENLEYNVEEIIKKSNKRVDIFVNNAGINGTEMFPTTSEREFDKIIDTNLKGMYFFSQVIVNYMIENKIKGNILNVTSSSALRPAISPYIISKWGERGLTLGMAKKYLPHGIIVNAIAPGSTSTKMIKETDFDDLNCEYSPSKRFLTPEEVGNIATILVSQMGRMIVGDTIYMTGGAGVLTYDDMSY